MAASPTRRLLILDDEPVVAQTVALAARRHGVAVRLSHSANTIFEDIASFSPTHIIIDLLMPDMDGVEVLRNLAQMHCEACIIVMSGMGSKVLESAQRAGIERGLRISGILPKPFKPSELHALLDADVQLASVPDAAEVSRGDISLPEVDFGLRSKQFVAHYQPKIHLDSERPAGVEALVRWQHPTLGLLSPDRFLALIERSGKMARLTDLMLDQGLAWFGTLSPDSDVKLAINVSGSYLTDVGLADALVERCRQAQVDPARIILELTETTATRRTAETFDILTRVRLKGFQLSIDDFGTGYSSLVQLVQLPFSEIKIDKSFVDAMFSSKEANRIVAITIALGKALHLTSVAEGVEREAQVRELAQMGCDQAQGHYFARAMDGESMRAWLAEHR